MVCYSYTTPQISSEIPNARTSARFLRIDDYTVELMGGMGTDLLMDLRIYDGSSKKWRRQFYANEERHIIPTGRFGHSVDRYKNNLILYGGAGPFKEKLK